MRRTGQGQPDIESTLGAWYRAAAPKERAAALLAFAGIAWFAIKASLAVAGQADNPLGRAVQNLIDGVEPLLDSLAFLGIGLIVFAWLTAAVSDDSRDDAEGARTDEPA
jgi:hypothetical protein